MGLGIDADKFHELSEEDYLQPFPFSGLTRDLKEAYTQNVYQARIFSLKIKLFLLKDEIKKILNKFYNEFFPGVQVHRRGKIFVSDLDKGLGFK